MHEVIFSDTAERQLKKLEKQMQKRVSAVIARILIRPDAHLQKLAGEETYKLRVGDYRLIIDFDRANRKLMVTKIGHRKNIYKSL